MVQAEILFLTKADLYDKTLVPTVSLYNEYFGGGMGSIVFQDLRESKALAYSAMSRYSNADRAGRWAGDSILRAGLWRGGADAGDGGRRQTDHARASFAQRRVTDAERCLSGIWWA